MDRTLILPLAPVLGWAMQTVIALTASLVGGFSISTILGAPALACALAFAFRRPAAKMEWGGSTLPLWIFAAAAVVALAPAAAVMPKLSGDSVFLAAPIFDHSKVALIDEILRDGVPPANPVFGESGAAGRVAYYYLWHFGAAQLANLTGATGWEADIAATWFTAFASLSLMCGLAFHLSQRTSAPLIVLVLSCCGSMRPVLAWLFGADRVDAVLRPASGFAGWLFQTTWSPHHVASASCVVLAVLLMVQLPNLRSVFTAIVLAFVVAAGFGSSIWVGGITFAVAGSAVGFVLFVTAERARRGAFLVACLAAGLGALGLTSPLIVEQIDAAGARGGGFPVMIDAFHVLGPLFPDTLRRIIDPLAYWLVLLPVEFPAVFIPGAVGLGALVLSKKRGHERRATAVAMAVLAAGSLFCAWLLVSTAGVNNDLGWRAVLPGVMVLIPAAGAGIAQWLSRPTPATVVTALAAICLALPDGANIIIKNVKGEATAKGTVFANDPDMWAAVRKYTTQDERVANNSLYLKDLTPWPINISWALLANRRSCFAGDDLALALVSMTPTRRKEISALFLRVFDGRGTVEDAAALAQKFGCRLVLVTIEDGAWKLDPFAANPLYRLAETRQGLWRIYVTTDHENAVSP